MVTDWPGIGRRGHAERPGHIPPPYPGLKDYSLNGGTTPVSHSIHLLRLSRLRTIPRLLVGAELPSEIRLVLIKLRLVF